MKSPLYATAVVLAIAALFLNCAAHDYYARTSNYKAKVIAAAVGNHTQYKPDAEIAGLIDSSLALGWLGMIFSVLGFSCMLIALFKREEGWYLILGGLLVMGIMARMLL